MIDLHMHSSYSNDGEFTPTELVEKCAQLGLLAMSIADHNCVKANHEAQMAAAAKGIKYISGIEIDCVYKAHNFHLLGYGFNEQSADFETIENNIKSQSFEASLQMLEKTQELGFRVTENDMWNVSKDCYWSETWTGEMFAEVLLSKEEYIDHPFLQPYRPGGERSDNPYVNFYWDYYSQGMPCYAEMSYPPMQDMIDLIHRNHGVAVLAHPGVNLKNNLHLLTEIIALGIDGIEAFSSYHSPAQSANFYQDVKQYHLFTTCGSDFHGKTKPSIALGGHGCKLSDDELFEPLTKIIG